MYGDGSSRIYEPSVLAEQALTFRRPHAVTGEAGIQGHSLFQHSMDWPLFSSSLSTWAAVPPLSDAVCDCYKITSHAWVITWKNITIGYISSRSLFHVAYLYVFVASPDIFLLSVSRKFNSGYSGNLKRTNVTTISVVMRLSLKGGALSV